jgi:hypothetical protein
LYDDKPFAAVLARLDLEFYFFFFFSFPLFSSPILFLLPAGGVNWVYLKRMTITK